METAVYILLGITSVVCVGVVLWRAWVLRWNQVVPPRIVEALTECQTAEDAKAVRSLCEETPSALGRLIRIASSRLDWPKASPAGWTGRKPTTWIRSKSPPGTK